MLEDVIGSLSQKVVERDAEIALLRSRLAQREKELEAGKALIQRFIVFSDPFEAMTQDETGTLVAEARAFLKAGD